MLDIEELEFGSIIQIDNVEYVYLGASMNNITYVARLYGPTEKEAKGLLALEQSYIRKRTSENDMNMKIGLNFIQLKTTEFKDYLAFFGNPSLDENHSEPLRTPRCPKICDEDIKSLGRKIITVKTYDELKDIARDALANL
jgi:hypothetical protein